MHPARGMWSFAVAKSLIHLVEDDAGLRATLTRLLESGDYPVKQYGSGSELPGAADSIGDGFVLLDIDMPGPDGFAVQRELAERGFNAPIILMSGAGDLTVLALKAGASQFMQKPFGRGELLSVLGQVSVQRRPHG